MSENAMLIIEEWLANMERELKRVQKLKPKDRLDTVSSIERCMKIVNSGSTGWLTWLTQPSIVKFFTKEELEEMFNVFTLLASRMLSTNIKYGGLLLNRFKDTKFKELENPGVSDKYVV